MALAWPNGATRMPTFPSFQSMSRGPPPPRCHPELVPLGEPRTWLEDERERKKLIKRVPRLLEEGR